MNAQLLVYRNWRADPTAWTCSRLLLHTQAQAHVPPSSEGSSAKSRQACLRHSFHIDGLSDRVIEVLRRYSEGNPLNPHIQEPGSCRIAGALNRAWIHFQPL